MGGRGRDLARLVRLAYRPKKDIVARHVPGVSDHGVEFSPCLCERFDLKAALTGGSGRPER